jgi:hypothetical protein
LGPDVGFEDDEDALFFFPIAFGFWAMKYWGGGWREGGEEKAVREDEAMSRAKIMYRHDVDTSTSFLAPMTLLGLPHSMPLMLLPVPGVKGIAQWHKSERAVRLGMTYQSGSERFKGNGHIK